MIPYLYMNGKRAFFSPLMGDNRISISCWLIHPNVEWIYRNIYSSNEWM